jgi:endoglucanase
LYLLLEGMSMRKLIPFFLFLCLLIGCTPAEEPADTPDIPPPEETMPPPEEPEEIFMLGLDILDTIHVDQLGYRPNDIKRAVLTGDAGVFYVCRASDGLAVYTGETSEAVYSAGSEEWVRVADFSGFSQPGEYYIADGTGRSFPFLIDPNPYGGLRKAVLRFFHYQKCGVEVDKGVWSHPACHTDLAFVLDTEGQRTGEVKDGSGGWHDAGDYSRYTVPGAQSVAQLLLAYELAPNPDEELLDEVWFKLEWMLKMQDPATGGVYHKVGCRNFNALDEMPHNERNEIFFSPISPTATANFAATMAMASRFYPVHREKLLDAARVAWEWCLQNPDAPQFTNPFLVVTGQYGDRSCADERFWAASELFAATGDESFHEYLKTATISVGLGWQRMGTYGIIAYLFHAGDKADATLTAQMRDALLNEAETVMMRYNNEPYGISLGDNFNWGSNMGVANNAMTLLLANIIDPRKAYIDAALEHMSYLLGKNALGQSYISGFGSRPMQNPHHRPSVAVGQTVPGMVAGGPNSGGTGGDRELEQARVGKSPMKSYIDHIGSYASNEVTIYWNSPVYFVLAVLDL